MPDKIRKEKIDSFLTSQMKNWNRQLSFRKGELISETLGCAR